MHTISDCSFFFSVECTLLCLDANLLDDGTLIIKKKVNILEVILETWKTHAKNRCFIISCIDDYFSPTPEYFWSRYMDDVKMQKAMREVKLFTTE